MVNMKDENKGRWFIKLRFVQLVMNVDILFSYDQLILDDYLLLGSYKMICTSQKWFLILWRPLSNILFFVS